ncbi:MAG: Mu-like prophage major head subunit gpT family protein [Treponema sp.]|jgi:phage major head subunit gpT-like protein|nr:Mu-like prophage major head subunit gpT family protein [Treponema sp.]
MSLPRLFGSLKPLVSRKRSEAEFEEITGAKNDRVFMRDTYFCGIRYRGGSGLWRQAAGSKAAASPAMG